MVVRDWLSSLLNDLMNCKRIEKKRTVLLYPSKLILEVLEIMKKNGYIENFKIENKGIKKVKIKIGSLNKCKSIKPRFFVKKGSYEKYIRRYLPARDFGILIVSTNKGLMTHKEAQEKGIG